jgi:hypothetical protein
MNKDMKKVIFVFLVLFIFCCIPYVQSETKIFTDEDLDKFESNQQNSNKTKMHYIPQKMEELSTYRMNDLTSEDLEYIKLMQDQEKLPKDMNSGTVKHEDIVKSKQAFKELYGFDYEFLRNPPKPDPRFSSPEKTWALHKNALAAGDIERVVECFIPQSAKTYRETYEALGVQIMREIAADMGSVVKIDGNDSYAKYEILRKQEDKIFSFELLFNNWFGEWKIVSY